MNTNDADLLHLFESLTTEQKIDIARRLLQNKEIKSTTVISSVKIKLFRFHNLMYLLLLPTFVFSLILTYPRMNSVY